MTNYALMFDNPWLLFLLIPALGFAIAPLFFLQKKYRFNRNRVASLVLHSTAITLAVFLLAGCTYSYDIPNKENELILLVDCSDSNVDSTDYKDSFIESVVRLCGDNYKLGIVKFGYNQRYVAEMSNDSEEVYRKYLESDDPDTSATDVAAALKYASTLFKTPETGKIVLLSDGIETDGAAMSVIKSIAAEGIKVDTMYYPNVIGDEVQIIGVQTPDYKIALNTDFVLNLDLQSNFGMTDMTNPDLERNVVNLTVYDNETPGESMPILLQNGVQTVDIPHKFESLGMHRLRFEISSPVDGSVKNNSYYTYIKLDDLNNILLIERRSGESQKLQDLLSENELTVTALGIDSDREKIPQTIKEICQYDQVILVNIANKDMPDGFDQLLYKYVNDFGGGLFTVGGENDKDGEDNFIPHAYDQEDLAGTIFAEMLPVQAVDYTPPVAVMLVIDCSGSMSMEKLPWAKEAALMSLDVLSSRDFCGVMSFDTKASENITVLPVSQRDKIEKAIKDVGKDEGAGSGGTIFKNAIDSAGRALASARVERRHIIMITDGKPSDELKDFEKDIENNVKGGITMSIVGVQIDNAGAAAMREICEKSGGQFYSVTSSNKEELANQMREDMMMNAITGIQYGEEFTPIIKDHTSLFAGINQEDMPPLTGYYGTRLKESEGASALLVGEYDVPIYAQWKFGAGTVGSFMCDLDGIWSEKFMNDPVGQKIIVNIVKNIFPLQAIKTDEIDAALKQDNYSVQVSVSSKLEEGESVALTITPLSSEAMEFYQDPIPVEVSDKFSRFSFDIICAGIYEIKIDKIGADGKVIATYTMYYAFSYSQEYNCFPAKEIMGEDYMTVLAEAGRGIVVEDAIDIFDTFEKNIHKTVDPALAMIITIIILFLLDVAVRKFKFKWPHELIKEYKEKKAEEAKR